MRKTEKSLNQLQSQASQISIEGERQKTQEELSQEQTKREKDVSRLKE